MGLPTKLNAAEITFLLAVYMAAKYYNITMRGGLPPEAVMTIHHGLVKSIRQTTTNGLYETTEKGRRHIEKLLRIGIET